MIVKPKSLGMIGPRSTWIFLLLVGWTTALFGGAVLDQDNSWINPAFGKWETNSNWSLGVAPNSVQAATFITNANSKTVTIDAITSGSFPGTLTISNLTLSAPAGSANTLFLNNPGLLTPLQVLNGLTISNNATLLVYSNATMQVENVSSTGSLIVDGGGFMNVLDGGALVATNLIAAIGNTGTGALSVTAGTVRVTNLGVAYGVGSQGTMTLADAIAQMKGDWWVGLSTGSKGAVWMSGGQLAASNSFTVIGWSGSGQMTMSNGALFSDAIFVGKDTGGGGTLTVVGGAIIGSFAGFYNALTAGDGVGSTGAVWITGGQLIATNSSPSPGGRTVVIGNSGIGQMTLSNSSVNVGTVTVAQNAGSAGTLTMVGGTLIANQLVATNTTATIQFPAGIMTLGGAQVANGQGFAVGGAGQTAVLNLVGGTNYFANGLSPGSVVNSTGAVWLTSGQLNTTNAPSYVGWYGDGQMAVSNGTWRAGEVIVGYIAGSQGTLTIAGGTNILSSFLSAGASGTGTVWVTGGQLIITNSNLFVSEVGVGRVTVSNGTCVVGGIGFGDNPSSQGTLTLAGGTITVLIDVDVGLAGTQTLWQTGGQLNVTNGVMTIGYNDVGRMTVSNGIWRTRGVFLGGTPGSQGTLTVAGGVSSVYSNVSIGNTNCSASGFVFVTGGELHVTNDDATGVLEIRDGTLIQTGGLLDIDRLVITNPCARFMHLGGTLIIGLETLSPNLDADGDGIPNAYELANGLDPLDPGDASLDNDGDGMSNLQEYLAGTDPNNSASYFHITAVAKEGNNVRVTWMTGLSKTNALQRTASVAGNYATNNFADIFIVTNTVGSVTNYLDIGGATNTPSRYYRVQLVP